MSAFQDHLKTGLTHVCLCWAIARKDGVIFGFTDHDLPLAFDGITFVAHSGMSAKALASSSGLSVNNTEAVGILTDASITEVDIAAGRYDDADVRVWQVQWDNVAARRLQFRGKIGEITRSGGAFQADLRGLTDLLNQPQGRSYLRSCSAVLGDKKCKVSFDDPSYAAEVSLDRASEGQVFDVATSGFHDRWFESGFVQVTSGQAKGLRGAIKHDAISGVRRNLTLWEPLRIPLVVGDTIKIIAGCDKRAQSCQDKFDNIRNFQGFPHIPGDDWLMSVPRSDDANDGGSLR